MRIPDEQQEDVDIMQHGSSAYAWQNLTLVAHTVQASSRNLFGSRTSVGGSARIEERKQLKKNPSVGSGVNKTGDAASPDAQGEAAHGPAQGVPPLAAAVVAGPSSSAATPTTHVSV
jgi:hypothetical protein